MKCNAIWPISDDAWCVTEAGFSEAEAGHRETLFTLANGYHSMRGSLELAPHYRMPGAFFAGLYDKAPVCFDKLAIVPNWTDLELVADGVRFDPLTCKLLSFRRTLDTRQGLLFTDIRWSDAKGHRTRYESCRLVHARHKHRALLWGRITPENWIGEITLSGGINADAVNQTHAVGGRMTIQHMVRDRFDIDEDGVVYEGHTGRTELPLEMRTQLRVRNTRAGEVERRKETLRELHRVQSSEGEPVPFVKAVAFQTTPIDEGESGLSVEAELEALKDDGVEATARSHVDAWGKRWEFSDVRIGGNPDDQAAVRFNLFHLIQSACEDTRLDVSIAAKGLHGEGYDGHIFWDTEVFMLPFFAVTDPDVAKSFLLYRYRRLPAAREHARRGGYCGAQFPWQSSVTGEEVTKWTTHDIVEHEWEPYELDAQHQVTASIALAVDWYRRVTGDEEFYRKYGAQLLMETARFWASRVDYDSRRDECVIRDLKCVDEYHSGVDNDAYTCYAAAENLRLGGEAAEDLRREAPKRFRELCEEIDLGQDEIEEWSEIASEMYFPMDDETGMIEEFDGYFDLPDRTAERDEDGWPMEPDDIDPYEGETQLIKQADVVLLFYLFGDRFSEKVKRRNYLYYLARDTHGSSLSASTYAIVGLDVDERDRAYQAFRHSAYRDLRPSTDPLGIHAACLGGTWQAVVNGFGGMRLRGDVPEFDPWLPPEWDRLAFRILWRGSLLEVEISGDAFTARLMDGEPVTIRVGDELISVDQEEGQ